VFFYEIQFSLLGFVIFQNVIEMDVEKVTTISKCPTSKSITKVRGFYGSMKFYKSSTQYFNEIRILCGPIEHKKIILCGPIEHKKYLN
jgi:hypothetical protein